MHACARRPLLPALQFASRFLAAIAPDGSGLTAQLLAASLRSEEASGQLYYVFEYTVQKAGAFFRHNLSVVTSRCAPLVARACLCEKATSLRAVQPTTSSSGSPITVIMTPFGAHTHTYVLHVWGPSGACVCWLQGRPALHL